MTGLLIVFILFIVTTIIGYLFLKWSQYKRSSRAFKNLPSPQNLGFFPIFKVVFTENGLVDLKDEITKAGHPALFNIGMFFDMTPCLVVCEPEAIRDVLTRTSVFQKHPLSYDGIVPLLGDGLVNSSGEEWKRQRHAINPIFKFKVLREYLPSMSSITSKFVEELRQDSGKEINATELMSKLTMRIIIGTVLGGDLDADDLAEKYKELVNDLTYIMFAHMAIGRFWKYLPFPVFFRFSRNVAVVENLIKQAIASRKAKLSQEKEDDGPSNETDLLSALLKVRDSDANSLSERELVDQVLTFLFAGSDTTSNLVAWVIYFMCECPEEQERVINESKEVLKNGDQVTGDVLNELHVIRRVLEETLRLRPPVPGFLDRIVTEKTTLKGIELEKGTAVTPWFLNNHTSPAFWGADAEEFKPDRFRTDPSTSKPTVGSQEPIPSQFVYTPFSAGPRNCIGQKFAMQEACVIVALLFKHFRFERVVEKPVVMQFVGTVAPIGLTVKLFPHVKS
eukprot:TRINITY_DN2972_c1_g3_i1.p1 TRINITY_DN2972_c1_g3~~TRINITY_DN2972_c1_g3_i1.p1  ORF type:complete len:507 (-),score=124.81 TRINITY_DN2972_c1_g3_i1:54-1574(-)